MTTVPPIPVPDERSAPFWKAAERGELVVARCSRCRELSHPPDLTCPRCRDPHPDFVFEQVSGRGEVRSWVTIRQSFLPGFDTPYLLVDVALDEDPLVRLLGRLVDGPDADVMLGAAVRVVFDRVDEHISVPAFRLEPESPDRESSESESAHLSSESAS